MSDDLLPQEVYDLVIIGTGAGGGTLAYALRNSGMRILLVERGDFLPQEPENWDPKAVFGERKYRTSETWRNAANGKLFQPGEYHFVGGKTKLYGAVLMRLRAEDFEATEHAEGWSPAWPIRYEDLEPYYSRAEEIYRVHGSTADDPTAPPRSSPYPFPPLPQDAYITDLSDKLRQQGVHPFSLPIGIDLQEGGRCIYCSTCDSYPCRVLAKRDADVACVRPALESADVQLLTRTYVHRLLTDQSGTQIIAADAERHGKKLEIRGRIFVTACGAVGSAALLLRSRNERHPSGLANSSGLVGRNVMFHNNTLFVAVHPGRRNTSTFQKSLNIMDFYRGSPEWPYPMGSVQLLGQMPLQYLIMPRGLRRLGEYLTQRSIQLVVMSEDLPQKDNRVTSSQDGRIQIHYHYNNLRSHKELVRLTRRLLRAAGYPLLLWKLAPVHAIAGGHQCGTLRSGEDPQTSVLDPYCRAHDISNLYAVDSSFFPSSAAVNPALTIMAQAFRVAEYLGASHA
jgi:choline dehydrogenase-like flavoprotein